MHKRIPGKTFTSARQIKRKTPSASTGPQTRTVLKPGDPGHARVFNGFIAQETRRRERAQAEREASRELQEAAERKQHTSEARSTLRGRSMKHAQRERDKRARREHRQARKQARHNAHITRIKDATRAAQDIRTTQEATTWDAQAT